MNKLADNPLVSIVVPIYNVEKYLEDCLNSIIHQSYPKLEIILVDDKTPDDSGKIASGYAKSDERIKVIHKSKNEGLNMARATGFEASTGEYVMFVDSDDVITDDCIEKSLLELCENDVDFVKFNFVRFKDEKTLLDAKGDLDVQDKKVIVKTKRDLFATRFTDSVVGASAICVWGGLYKSKVIRNLDWTESNYRINEDNFWTLELFNHINSGVYVSRVGYLYRSDDSYQGVLSKAMTGNSYNGEPVGYLEFIKKYFDKFYYYNAKYKLELNKDIELLEAWMWIDRLINVSQNNLLDEENNREFLPIALAYLIRDYKDKKSLNNDRKEQLKKLKLENDQLRREIKTFHSIQRSARLLAGNLSLIHI